MWNKLIHWLNEKKNLPLENHNESSRTWSKGYRKAFTETSDFVEEIREKDNTPLIIGMLTVLFLFIAFTALYIDYSKKIDINTASIEALESLPDIGPILAKRIVDGRPYIDVYELDRVKGIGPETIEAIKWKVKVEGL